MIYLHDRRGSLTLYAVILVIILGSFVAAIQVSAVDQNLSLNYALYEAQARQGADAALEICLRVATTTQNVSGSHAVQFPDGPVGSMTLLFQTSQAPATNALASVTAIVYGRNNFEVARRSARNRINITARKFKQKWERQ